MASWRLAKGIKRCGYWQNLLLTLVLWSIHQLWRQASWKTGGGNHYYFRITPIATTTIDILCFHCAWFMLSEWDYKAISISIDELQNSMSSLNPKDSHINKTQGYWSRQNIVIKPLWNSTVLFLRKIEGEFNQIWFLQFREADFNKLISMFRRSS